MSHLLKVIYTMTAEQTRSEGQLRTLGSRREVLASPLQCIFASNWKHIELIHLKRARVNTAVVYSDSVTQVIKAEPN